jgi:hypothetical protein
MDDFKHDVVVTLLLLKKKIPPSFFNTMTQLLVHLVEELKFVLQCIHFECILWNIT